MWLSHDCSKSNEFLTPACFSKGDASLCTRARNSSLRDNFWTVLRLHMCKHSVRHVSITKYLWSIVSIDRQRLVKYFFGTISVFECPWTWCKTFLQKLKKTVHGPGPWKWSMDPVQTGGPWTPGPCFVLTPWKVRCLNQALIVKMSSEN